MNTLNLLSLLHLSKIKKQLINYSQKVKVGGDGDLIGGSRVHFPLHTGETPSRSTEEQNKQPTAPQRLWR